MENEKFAFTAIIELEVKPKSEENGKNIAVTHAGLKYSCEFSESINANMYFGEDRTLNKEGCEVFTTVAIEGLIANIHTMHQRGFRDSAEHLRYIIEKLEKGFVQQVEVGSAEWDK